VDESLTNEEPLTVNEPLPDADDEDETDGLALGLFETLAVGLTEPVSECVAEFVFVPASDRDRAADADDVTLERREFVADALAVLDVDVVLDLMAVAETTEDTVGIDEALKMGVEVITDAVVTGVTEKVETLELDCVGETFGDDVESEETLSLADCDGGADTLAVAVGVETTDEVNAEDTLGVDVDVALSLLDGETVSVFTAVVDDVLDTVEVDESVAVPNVAEALAVFDGDPVNEGEEDAVVVTVTVSVGYEVHENVGDGDPEPVRRVDSVDDGLS
jgi:hypothetical protein